jgi:ASPIC and UnbV/FG-GAP-like repeat
MSALILRSLAAAVLSVPLAAQAGFDLLEINKVPGPDNPGVDYTYAPVSAYVVEGSGTAIADVNEDGFQDLMFFGTETRPNLLYINNGDGHFTESAAAYGVNEPTRRRGFGAFFDFDNDGDLDLITCGYPGYLLTINLNLWSLFRNDGPAGSYHFTNISGSSGGFVLAPTVETTTLGVPGGISVADYDRDGFLDVCTTYWNRNTAVTGFAKDQFRLWKNIPNPNPDMGEPDYTPRKFTDATKDAGLDGAGTGWIWAPSFVDFDRDGWPDFHLNVEGGLDELRLNLHDGTFGPSIATAVGLNYNSGTLIMGQEMGVIWADYDNDADLDGYLTNSAENFEPGKLDAFYRNDSDLSQGGAGLQFENIGPVVGTDSIGDFGWGVIFPDMDCDGDGDLLTTRGHGTLPGNSTVWLNLFPQLAGDGESVALQDASARFTEFNALSTNRSLAAFDYDHDGDLDVVTTRSGVLPGDNYKAGFWRNTLPATTHWLQLDLTELNGSLNTIGARVFVRTGGAGGTQQMQEIQCGGSFLNQLPYRLHFGLGAAESADWVLVRWFDGQSTVVVDSQPEPLQGLRSIARTAQVSTGDVNGDGVMDCADVKALHLGLLDAAAVDAQYPDWPWRLLADMNGNGALEKSDFHALRALVPDGFCDVGAALAGTHGEPLLAGDGTLQPLTLVTLSLSNVLENTSTWLVVGLSMLDGPFKSGVLVPNPDILVGPFGTGPAGILVLPSPWPAGIPAGLQFQFQYWTQDGAAVSNFSASNDLAAVAH